MGKQEGVFNQGLLLMMPLTVHYCLIALVLQTERLLTDTFTRCNKKTQNKTMEHLLSEKSVVSKYFAEVSVFISGFDLNKVKLQEKLNKKILYH